MTSLRIDTGQTLASLIKGKVRHANSQSSPWDEYSDRVFRKKQSSEPTKPIVPSDRKWAQEPIILAAADWIWVGV